MLKKMQTTKRRYFCFIIAFFTAITTMIPTTTAQASSTQITGKSTIAQTVYAGPSSSNYTTIGSIGAGEVVYILGKEQGLNWYHIQYHAGNRQKSGYVPTSTITSISGGSPSDEMFYGGFAYSNSNQTVWSCDEASIAVNIGSIGSGEGVTRLYAYGNVMFIEYSTSSGAKRGYVYSPNFSYPDITCVGRVTSNSNISYGYKENFTYLSAGTVYMGEYVSVIATSNSKNIAYVEYNTNSGRKRGYMTLSNLSLHNAPNNLPNLYGWSKNFVNVSYPQARTIYAGPSTQYAVVGSISANETVYYDTEIQINGVWYTYIYYRVNGTNSLKSGFVL